MTTREQFTDEEWATVGQLPGLVLMAASISDGHVIPSIRELSAGAGALAEGIKLHPDNAVLQSLTAESPDSETKDALHGEDGDKPENAAEMLDLIVGQIEPAVALLRSKVTTEEFGQVSEVLTAAATATIERLGDGFMGSGEKVTESERTFLARLAGILA